MIHFMAWQMTYAIDFLRETECVAGVLCIQGQRDLRVPPERVKDYYLPLFQYCEKQSRRVGLSASVQRINRHIIRELTQGLTWDALRGHAKVLRETMQSDLTYQRFAYVPTEKAKVLDGLDSAWGAVWDKFGSTKDDSTEAVNCYALGRNTACVFHLMRVAEHGLRALAREQGIRKVKGKQPLEWAEWQSILGELGRKAEALAQRPRGPARDAALEFYRGALGEFQGFKDEYRNHVMHARKSYDEHQAARALRQVHDFMGRLALRLDEVGHRINWRKVTKA